MVVLVRMVMVEAEVLVAVLVVNVPSTAGQVVVQPRNGGLSPIRSSRAADSRASNIVEIYL